MCLHFSSINYIDTSNYINILILTDDRKLCDNAADTSNVECDSDHHERHRSRSNKYPEEEYELEGKSQKVIFVTDSQLGNPIYSSFKSIFAKHQTFWSS